MDNVLLLDAVRAAHLAGLAVGLGPALCADLLVARSFLCPIQRSDIEFLKRLHMLISFGLVMLWISGLMLLQIRTGFELSQFSPKLWTKLAVVILLTGNAIAIGKYAMPRLERNVGYRFGQIELSTLINLSIFGGLSMFSWVSALALGAFSQLKPMPFEGLYAVFAPIFVAGLTGAILMGLAAFVIARATPGAAASMDRATT